MIDPIPLVLFDKIMKLEEYQRNLRKLVNSQANDHGLWFEARTAPESYLQQELRKLHAVVEGAIATEKLEAELVHKMEC